MYGAILTGLMDREGEESRREDRRPRQLIAARENTKGRKEGVGWSQSGGDSMRIIYVGGESRDRESCARLLAVSAIRGRREHQMYHCGGWSVKRGKKGSSDGEKG